MRRIKTLKRGYVHHAENLKKIKGRINIQKNEKLNIASKRYDRIFCEYEEYSVDIPENRLLKKALLFSKRMVKSMGEEQSSFSKINEILSKSLMLFENVNDEVDLKEIKQAKMHKLFSEYSEAIRLAKLILKHFDYSIHNVGESNEKVIPFDLDMSLLYEHYVYGLLHEAYQERIRYQFIGNKSERPDFLYKSDSFRAILDTKYKPKLINYSLDIEDIRQLSGYGRDLRVLRWLGYDDITETSSTPSVPCIIIYPIDSNETSNPFKNKELEELCSNIVKGISQFYLISVPIPTMQRQIYST
jgi:5-methylcytosine-specific restriction enzyme subunit McrC